MRLPFFRSFSPKTPENWQVALRSDAGRQRKSNQDAFLNAQDQALWAVADGMGGHSSGEWASKTIVAALAAIPLSGSLKNREQLLRQQLQKVNLSIKRIAEESQQRSGSTLVVLHIFRSQALYLWVGDSRIYRWRQGVFTQVTHDHSLTERLIAQGKISREDADSYPAAHVITRAVGIEEQVLFDSCYENILPGDAWLLCSDGLSREVSDATITKIFNAASSLEIAANNLLKQALDNGGRDNITLCLVQGDSERTST